MCVLKKDFKAIKESGVINKVVPWLFRIIVNATDMSCTFRPDNCPQQ